MSSLTLWQDTFGALAKTEFWFFLGWQDIRQRYRRSVLGPLWLTLSTAIMVIALGVVYSGIFKQPIEKFIPFFAIGNVIWNYISGTLIETSTAYTQFEPVLKQIRFPFLAIIARVVSRNLIILLHNAIVVIGVFIYFGVGIDFQIIWIIPALLLVSLTLIFAGSCIALLCTRFRDFPPIITSFLLIVFFITPVFWTADSLRASNLALSKWILDLNPFYYMVEAIRSPLLATNQQIDFLPLLITLCLAIFFAALSTALMARYRHRITFWL